MRFMHRGNAARRRAFRCGFYAPPSLSARRAAQNSGAAIAGIVRAADHRENADLRRNHLRNHANPAETEREQSQRGAAPFCLLKCQALFDDTVSAAV
jgi:hypothetical protein